MTLVASPRTRNLSLSSARAVPASKSAAAISSAMLGFMGETSLVFVILAVVLPITAAFHWLAKDENGKNSKCSHKGPDCCAYSTLSQGVTLMSAAADTAKPP